MAGERERERWALWPLTVKQANSKQIICYSKKSQIYGSEFLTSVTKILRSNSSEAEELAMIHMLHTPPSTSHVKEYCRIYVQKLWFPNASRKNFLDKF